MEPRKYMRPSCQRGAQRSKSLGRAALQAFDDYAAPVGRTVDSARPPREVPAERVRRVAADAPGVGRLVGEDLHERVRLAPVDPVPDAQPPSSLTRADSFAICSFASRCIVSKRRATSSAIHSGSFAHCSLGMTLRICMTSFAICAPARLF